MSSNESISAVLADEQVLYLQGLKSIMSDAIQGLSIVGMVHDGPTLIDTVEAHQPELVCLNIRLPKRDGLDLIAELKERCPGTRVIVLSEYNHSKFIKQAFQNGADGYMLKRGDMKQLEKCVAEVMEGGTYMGEGVSIGPLHRPPEIRYEHDWDKEDAFLIKSNLTKRELEVLSCIADEMNNKQIAQALFISDQTVGVHRKNIMKKLNVRSTANLIQAAQEIGLVSL